jgi:hypothetical protein
MASTGAVPTASVWVQLYYIGDEKPVGESIEITPIPKNVNALKEKVHAEKQTKLAHVDANDLRVYASGTTLPIPENAHSLRPGKEVFDCPTTDETPLIVIAPKRE